VNFWLTNVGKLAGAEVAQMYIGRSQHQNFPIRELKGFKKVFLQPGETQNIELITDARAFSHYDENVHAWTEDEGAFQLQVGSSSRDLKLSQTLQR
jgi:beta-glucosidase